VPSLIQRAQSALTPDPDKITVRVGEQYYDSFESINITHDLNSLAQSFSLSFLDKWRESKTDWVFVPGVEIAISIGSNKILNGFVDRVETSVSKSDRTLQITGRSRAGILVNVSAGTGTSQAKLNNVSVKEIIDNFCLNDHGIVTAIDEGVDQGDKYKEFVVRPGESIWETISRAAKDRGLLIISDTNGNLILTNRAREKIDLSKLLVESFDFTTTITNLDQSQESLVQGENILEAKAVYDNTERFGSYIVRSQLPPNDYFKGVDATQIEATTGDAGVDASKVLLLISDNANDVASCQKRVNWEASVRAAKSFQVEITVLGWLKSDTRPWAVNEMVNVEAGFLGLAGGQQLLIHSVNFSQDRSKGTVTSLGLTRADAFIPDPDVKETHQLTWADAKKDTGVLQSVKETNDSLTGKTVIKGAL
jgi:prophage tail gpP-like protein